MANITANIEEFFMLYPQFNNEQTAQMSAYYLNVSINHAQRRWELCRFGCRLNEAIYLLTAHKVAVNQQLQSGQGAGGQNGQVASANVGEVSVSYNNYHAKNALEYEYSLTPYGLQFLALLNEISPLPQYIGGSLERIFS